MQIRIQLIIWCGPDPDPHQSDKDRIRILPFIWCGPFGSGSATLAITLVACLRPISLVAYTVLVGSAKSKVAIFLLVVPSQEESLWPIRETLPWPTAYLVCVSSSCSSLWTFHSCLWQFLEIICIKRLYAFPLYFLFPSLRALFCIDLYFPNQIHCWTLEPEVLCSASNFTFLRKSSFKYIV